MASAEPARPDIFLPGGQPRSECLTDAAAQVLGEAVRLARETNWESVRSPHLFMGLLSVPDAGVQMWGDRLGADLAKLLGQFQELFHQEEGEPEAVLAMTREFFSDNVIRLLREAFHRAADHRRRVTPFDVLICLFTTPKSIVADCFEQLGFTAAKLTELAVIAEQQCSARSRSAS